MNRWKWLIAAALLLAKMPLPSGHAEEQQVPALMKKKLEHAQQVLEGIALNDFDKIAAGAGDLIQTSKAAEWRVLKTAPYEVYSTEFRAAAETMRQNAKVKNLDGAALAYVELTLTCVKCHKHVREVRMAQGK